MFVSVGKGPICYGFHGNQLNYLTYGQYQYIGCNLLCWKGWECKTYIKLKTMCTNMQMICKLANNVHWLCSLCVVLGRRCYAATSIAFVLNMSSQDAVFLCNVNCLCSSCVVIERRCYDATSISLAMSPQNAVVMIQRQPSQFFLS